VSNGATLEALQRSIRVADQQATAYAALRDRYAWWSRVLDVAILLLSIWLVAMAFVAPHIGNALSPTVVGRELWLGLLAILTFMLSALQLLVNWKGRAESYARSLAAVSSFVKTYRRLSRDTAPDVEAVRRALAAYQAVSDSIEAVPESQFLRLKRKHLLKMEISEMLDSRPGMSVWLAYVRLYWRDNFAARRAPDER